MRDFLRRNGLLVLLAALVLSVAIGVGSAMSAGGSDPVSSAVASLTTPIRGAVNGVLSWGQSVYEYVAHYGELHQQLSDLEQQVAQLEEEVRQSAEAERENEQLRALLELQEKRRDFVFESARVTERSTADWESTLTLSKGSSAGVAVGNCVITETGRLVGVVTEVGLNYALVSTVINPDLEMGGVVTRTYSAGVLTGDFALMQEGRLKLAYLPDSAQLVAGDEVVTSGKGDVYPSGLVVGRVEGVFTDPSGMNRYAVVRPDVELDSLIEVFIIKDFDIVE